MATFKKSEIRAIAARTPAEFVGKQICEFPSYSVGFYRPAGANWSYQVDAINGPFCPVLVVSVFGEIKGAI